MLHHRPRLVVAENRRHGGHKLNLGELLPGAIPHALGPGDEGAFGRGLDGFGAEAGSQC